MMEAFVFQYLCKWPRTMIELNASRKLFQCCLAVLLCASTVGAQQWEDPLLQYPKCDSCQQKSQSELRAGFKPVLSLFRPKEAWNFWIQIRIHFTGGLFTEVRTSGRETWTMSWGKETEQISDTWNLTRVMWLIPHHNSNCLQELYCALFHQRYLKGPTKS